MTREDYIAAVQAKLLADDEKFPADELEQAARLIEAAANTITANPFDRDPHAVRELLESLSSGYGCWLDCIDKATKQVAHEAPEKNRIWAWRMNGAISALGTFIFDIGFQKSKEAKAKDS